MHVTEIVLNSPLGELSKSGTAFYPFQVSRTTLNWIRTLFTLNDEVTTREEAILSYFLFCIYKNIVRS